MAVERAVGVGGLGTRAVGAGQDVAEGVVGELGLRTGAVGQHDHVTVAIVLLATDDTVCVHGLHGAAEGVVDGLGDDVQATGIGGLANLLADAIVVEGGCGALTRAYVLCDGGLLAEGVVGVVGLVAQRVGTLGEPACGAVGEPGDRCFVAIERIEGCTQGVRQGTTLERGERACGKACGVDGGLRQVAKGVVLIGGDFAHGVDDVGETAGGVVVIQRGAAVGIHLRNAVADGVVAVGDAVLRPDGVDLRLGGCGAQRLQLGRTFAGQLTNQTALRVVTVGQRAVLRCFGDQVALVVVGVAGGGVAAAGVRCALDLSAHGVVGIRCTLQLAWSTGVG